MRKPFFNWPLIALAGLLFLILAPSIASAQPSAGMASGLDAADKGIRGVFVTLISLIYVIMGVIGLVGAVQVYGKWSNGDPETRKAAASWFGALIFAGLVVIVLKAVFTIA